MRGNRADEAAIEHLLDLGFGLSRRTKTSYRLREGSTPVSGLSLVVEEPGFGLLSEEDVMRLIARGYTYREVAGRLHLSVKTISTYRTPWEANTRRAPSGSNEGALT